jgi:ubiquinone/menaquinone biosynthesis C-methylase UbiE
MWPLYLHRKAISLASQSLELIADEVGLLASLVPLAGASVLELGCGSGDFARKLVERTPIASVAAFEVDRIQHRRNLASKPDPRLAFHRGGAEDIALPDGSVDGVVMMKSLHHVPVESMDRAMREIRRVLKPGGWLYVSEPLYAGDFNDIVKLFHDEGAVRAAAYEALKRASRDAILAEAVEREFMAPLAFRDFADFEERVVRATHSGHSLSPELLAQVRSRFEKHLAPGGARFIRPMRVNLLRAEP